jgi:hypothetical protein
MIGMLHHKVAAYMLCSALFMLFGVQQTAAQEGGPGHRIHAVIPELRSASQAHTVDIALRAVPGVRMSRTDFNTRNVLIEVAADCTLTRDAVQALLEPFSLHVSCWSRDQQDAGLYQPLDPRSCSELTPIR